MKKHDLLNTLATLKRGRVVLVADYCNEEPRLYRPMFLHKSPSSEMNIAIDRYIFNWLTQHPSYYHETIKKTKNEVSPTSDSEIKGFVKSYRKLCEKFVVGNAHHSDDKSYVLENVVKESIDYLENLLTVSERADERLERLRYQGEKSKHLFDRALKELLEDNNGIL